MTEPAVPSYRYPCTGHVEHRGFGDWLESHLGPPRANLKAFAGELGRLFGLERITLVNSGSSANLAAAAALAERCGPRPHAVAAGFTFPTTLSALLRCGFEVTLVDTEPGGFGAAPSAIERALRPETRLVCVTHFLGFPAAIEEIADLARRRQLLLLQDCCETMDLRIGGKPAWQWGTLATWSFYHPHHLSAFGGGTVVSLDEEWQRTVESLVHWGRACSCQTPSLECRAPAGMDHNFWYVREGFNLELSELNACFGRFQLESWTGQEAARRRHYEILHARLAGHARLSVHSAPEHSGSPFVFPITVKEGDARDLAQRLMARGVEVRSLMGGVASGQPAFRHLPTDGLANCTHTAATSFFVGVHQTLAEEDVAAVAGIVAEEASR